MNKNYLIIGGATLIVLILIISIIAIIININSDKTENFTPALPSKYTGGSFMVMDKNGNIDTLAISELESRIDKIASDLAAHKAATTAGLAEEREYAKVRRDTLNDKINLFFPNGGKDISLAKAEGGGRVTITNKQMRMLTGESRLSIKNHGDEPHNRILAYDRNKNEVKWGAEDLATINTNPSKNWQGDMSLMAL